MESEPVLDVSKAADVRILQNWELQKCSYRDIDILWGLIIETQATDFKMMKTK